MLNFCKQPEHHILLRLHLISGLCPGVINIKKLSTNKKTAMPLPVWVRVTGLEPV